MAVEVVGEKTWEQLEEEPNIWHARFRQYLILGNGRSLYGAYVKSTKKPNKQVPGAWKDAAKKWHWFDRAHAWDLSELDKLSQKVYAQQIEEIKAELEDAERIRKVGRHIIDSFLSGERAIDAPVLQAARASLIDATKQARLALGMATDFQHIREDKFNSDLSDLSIEQLQRISAGENVYSVMASTRKSRIGASEEN